MDQVQPLLEHLAAGELRICAVAVVGEGESQRGMFFWLEAPAGQAAVPLLSTRPMSKRELPVERQLLAAREKLSRHIALALVPG